jgi:hypothetical protein
MTHFTDYLTGIITRDLRAARREVEAYPDDEMLWTALPGTTNTGGSLARHIAGNLQHFFGAVLGSSGYVRDREAEFNQQPVPREVIRAELDAAVTAIESVLPGLPDEVFAAPFPIAQGGLIVNTQDFVLHLAVHLCYHLGQLDYHRRIVTGRSETVSAQAMKELRSAQPAA